MRHPPPLTRVDFHALALQRDGLLELEKCDVVHRSGGRITAMVPLRHQIRTEIGDSAVPVSLNP